MSQYIAKTVAGAFDALVADVSARLGAQGFGALSDRDVPVALRAQIGAETPK